MAKSATAIPLITMALLALLSVTLHLQAQAAAGDGATSVLEQVAATNLECRPCHCCEITGNGPLVCYTKCCYASKTAVATCGCATCGGK
ncbi:hypothetical protein ACP70R_046980 [Stipagrostis hirtigluma subsp. patula]